MLKKIFRSYRDLPRDIHFLILMEFTLSLIHVAFILILNIFLRKQNSASNNAPKAKTVRPCTISNGEKVRNLPNSPVRLTKGRATKTLITPWRCDVLALVKSDINQC